MLTATTTRGLGEPGGPTGRVPCPHAGAPGAEPVVAGGTPRSTQPPGQGLRVGAVGPAGQDLQGEVGTPQLHLPHPPRPFPAAWGPGYTVPGRVGCAPCPAAPLPPPSTAGSARVTPAPGRAVPAAPGTAPGTSAGPGGGSSRLTQNLLQPALSSPSPVHLLPRGCRAGAGACVGQLGGLNLLAPLLCPWWSLEHLWLRAPRAPGDGVMSRAGALGAGLEVPGDSSGASCAG